MTVVGYMRVSTHHQKFDSQLHALEKYGVDKLYEEYESGKKSKRDVLSHAISTLQKGDIFVIAKLDRLSRRTKDLLTMVEEFNTRGIQFVSLKDDIDTSTPSGKFFFTIMSAFAEMEAELIRERVIAGLDAAKENGTTLGRPVKEKQIQQAMIYYQESKLSLKEISDKCHISVATIHNHRRKLGISSRKETI